MTKRHKPAAPEQPERHTPAEGEPEPSVSPNAPAPAPGEPDIRQPVDETIEL